jgi:hypothetical protein
LKEVISYKNIVIPTTECPVKTFKNLTFRYLKYGIHDYGEEGERKQQKK